MENYILEMRNIRKTFLGGKVVANDDVTLKIKKGEKHAIVGENGAGKSTLMQILNGLYQPTSGEIYFHGKICRRFSVENYILEMRNIRKTFLGGKVVANDDVTLK